MRPSLVGIAASLLASTAAVRAQPGLEPRTIDDGGTLYLEPGIEAGDTRIGLFGALELDGGYHLSSTPFWLHGRLAHGAMRIIEETTMTSDFTEARLGLEARGCELDGIACLIGGVDFGLRHELLVTNHTNQVANNAVAIARVGFDLGSRHLRLRPSLEAAVQPGHWNSLGFTAGIAYTW
jgi:hypothetical protein